MNGYELVRLQPQQVKKSGDTITGNLTATGGAKFVGDLQGNADTATRLQTARQINGTNFNGATNIVTANWGTARSIQIGNSAKQVNGGSNVTWTLNDIGAASSNHTHNYAGSNTAGGSANSAVRLQTARNITIGNATKPFDGSADISFTLQEIGAGGAGGKYPLDWEDQADIINKPAIRRGNGTNSIKESNATSADGNYSHAEGNGTTTRGQQAHAEGWDTRANGDSSHAEGEATQASGQCSHAEGGFTEARSYGSHAEGNQTIAEGQGAHSEGGFTKAVGSGAHAEGYRTSAQGYGSHSEGHSTKAHEQGAHSEGNETEALGFASHAEGKQTKATQSCAHAEGSETEATGMYSHAEGDTTTASGPKSHSQGFLTTASGQSSHAEGTSTVSSGYSSHSEGYESIASGYTAHAQNNGTIAKGYCQTSIGRYNVAQGTADSSTSTDNAFIIGNGNANANTRSNAFRVTWGGITYSRGAYNTSGADYAEMFEWSDLNPNNEDRVGYFVTLEGEKIRKANSNDKYILGIVSSNPSIIGNNPIAWKDMHEVDEWGRPITEVIEETSGRFISETEEDEEIMKIETFKINKKWDNTLEYVSRDLRKEWASVGLLGQLLVRDDGTCKIGGLCKVNDDGIATHSDNKGYYVMNRVNENIIKVMIK